MSCPDSPDTPKTVVEINSKELSPARIFSGSVWMIRKVSSNRSVYSVYMLEGSEWGYMQQIVNRPPGSCNCIQSIAAMDIIS